MRRRVALGVVAVVALAGCSGAGDAATPDESPTDSEAAAEPEPAAGAGATEVELPFEGGYDWRIAIAPDGLTALVAQSDGFFPQTRQSTIHEVTLQDDGSWGDPVEVPFVSDDSQDIDPWYTPDGTRVWFSSIRPVDGADRADVEVWYVDRLPDGAWGEPVHAAAVGSEADDLYPTIGPDGALYVGSDRGPEFDVWRVPAGADGAWEAAAALPAPVSTDVWEFNPVFGPDGALVFTSLNRDGGQGLGDLFLTRLEGETWSEPVPLASVNTPSDEYHPAFSPDGETLYFVRSGDLHQIAVADTELAG